MNGIEKECDFYCCCSKLLKLGMDNVLHLRIMNIQMLLWLKQFQCNNCWKIMFVLIGYISMLVVVI
jgi:hypothetical protein